MTDGSQEFGPRPSVHPSSGPSAHYNSTTAPFLNAVSSSSHNVVISGAPVPVGHGGHSSSLAQFGLSSSSSPMMMGSHGGRLGSLMQPHFQERGLPMPIAHGLHQNTKFQQNDMKNQMFQFGNQTSPVGQQVPLQNHFMQISPQQEHHYSQASTNLNPAIWPHAQQNAVNPQYATYQHILMQQAQQQMQQAQQAQHIQQMQQWGQIQHQSQLQASQQLNSSNSNVNSSGFSPEEQPAKRRAVDFPPIIRQRLDQYAAERLKALEGEGRLAGVDAQEYPMILNKIRSEVYMRYIASLTSMSRVQSNGNQTGEAQTVIHTTKSNMRVAIDKKNRSEAEKLVNVEEMAEEDHADEVMRRCEEISKKLKEHIGKEVDGATDWEGAQHVTLDKLIEACGDTAKYLKPYQVVGINFLNTLYTANVGGAILADEMGLGKTAQIICYLGVISCMHQDSGPHLITVPASLLENWQRELRRWCPRLRTVVYYGKHRMAVRKRIKELREKIESGEEISDDLADLNDEEMLAQLVAKQKQEEAVAADAEEEDSYSAADVLGGDDDNDDDEDFDYEQEKNDEIERNGGSRENSASIKSGAAPIQWDYSKALEKAPFDVMLTSYTLFERDSTEQRLDREFLESWKWSHLIMDEAHALKNRDARRSTRLRRVANVSRRRIMITGTPLQNDLLELQNLMNFLLPQVFESEETFDNLEEMIEGNEDEVHRLTVRMKQLLGPFVLRRLKTEVAGQLTEKRRMTDFVEMTLEQSALYEESLASMRSQIGAKAEDMKESSGGDSSASVEKFIKKVGAKKISHMFTHLRKIAQHPLLVRHQYDDATVDEIAEKAAELEIFSGNATLRRIKDELLSYSDYSLHAFCYNGGPHLAPFRLNSTHLMSSTKFRYLAELLPKLKEKGSRPLIFSQWTSVLDLIEWLMDELRLPYVRLDGSTVVDERLATVDRFNTSDDVFAFLLSTRAGGQGLNLTGADTVILHDVDFNPQIDKQAEDRCHRLGQTKEVTVYRLVTKNTVDQNIYKLSQQKLKLDAAVLKGITTGKGTKQKEAAAERQQMGNIMHRIFTGEEKYEETIEEDTENKNKESVPKEKEMEGIQRQPEEEKLEKALDDNNCINDADADIMNPSETEDKKEVLEKTDTCSKNEGETKESKNEIEETIQA